MTRFRFVALAVLVTAVIPLEVVEAQRRQVLGGAGRRQPLPAGTDEKDGAIEIKTVKMRQGASGGSFITSGGSYQAKADRALDFQVDWKAEKPISGTPQLTIDWGSGEPSRTTCGLCRVEKTLPAGTYSVVLRMDDGKGGVTKRAFTLTLARQ
jgi:hypothetical protein